MIRHRPVSPETFKNIDQLPMLFANCGRVEFAYLFGGALKGPRPLSDIDLAVYCCAGTNLGEYKPDLLGKLNDLLETDEIDLVILNQAPISLAGRIIIRKRLLFCRNDFLRHRFESLTLRKFHDFQIYEKTLLTRRYHLG